MVALYIVVFGEIGVYGLFNGLVWSGYGYIKGEELIVIFGGKRRTSSGCRPSSFTGGGGRNGGGRFIIGLFGLARFGR